MLIFVIFCNLLLTLLNCYLVFRVWKLRRFLVKVTRTFTKLERCSHRVFYRAPEVIIQGQQGTYQLRQSYQKLLRQIQRVQRILRLLKLGWRIWQGQKIKNYKT